MIELGSSGDRGRIRQALQRVSVTPPTGRPASDARSDGARAKEGRWTTLERALTPGSVWLVLTDLYFAEEAEVLSLAARIRNAQQGSRWVVVVDFDSWACETCRLGHGLRRLDGPGVSAPELRVRLTPGLLDEVKERIEERKRRFDRAASAGGYERLAWTWPAEADPPASAIFREQFFGQEIVRRLVMPDGAR